MRSKMLGLAIALSTFGLGVAATTAWIAYHTPNVPVSGTLVMTRTELIPVPEVNITVPSEVTPVHSKTSDSTIRCEWSSRKNATVDAGVLNGRGLHGETPAPVYPPIAKAAQASGTVVVQVLVDECGHVLSARAVSGNSLLQQAAVQAAYGWHLAPGLLGGEPVKVRGTLTFNFVLE